MLLAACGSGEKPADLTSGRESEKATGISGYEMGQVVEKRLASSVRLPGQLRPFNEVNIYAKINSFVKQVYVDRGSTVDKGQLLVELEAPEMLSQLQSASARLIQAQETASASRENYRRLSEAAKEAGAVSPMELDNAQAKMRADQAVSQSEKSNVEAMKTVQSYLNVRAPFSGMVVQRNISPGALVGPGKSQEAPMLILQDISRLRLEVSIPESYVDKVDLEKQVSFVFNSLPGQERRGKIARSSNMLGSLQSEVVEIDVSNTNNRLKPGMYCEVRIPLLSGAKSLLVPNHAIVRSTERQYVIKNLDGKASFVDVKEVIAANDSTEVFGNLQARDTLVLHANDEIKEGQTLVNVEAPESSR